jgi:hypothetical protein
MHQLKCNDCLPVHTQWLVTGDSKLSGSFDQLVLATLHLHVNSCSVTLQLQCYIAAAACTSCALHLLPIRLHSVHIRRLSHLRVLHLQLSISAGTICSVATSG